MASDFKDAPADDIGRPQPYASRGSTAAAISQSRFGGPTVPRFTVVNVGTSPTRLFKNDPRRVAFTIMNRSVSEGALWRDSEFTFATGFLMGANGGECESDVFVDGEAVTYEIFGISNGSAGVWAVEETLRV